MKTCSRCGKEQPREDFSRNRGAKDGLFAWCRTCSREARKQYRALHPDKDKEWSAAHPGRTKQWFADHPSYRREWHLKNRYGITAEDYDRMFAEQEGACLICGATGNLHVDHDHETGQVRSLLCGPCNRGIGLLGENPRLMRAAARYVEHRWEAA